MHCCKATDIACRWSICHETLGSAWLLAGTCWPYVAVTNRMLPSQAQLSRRQGYPYPCAAKRQEIFSVVASFPTSAKFHSMASLLLGDRFRKVPTQLHRKLAETSNEIGCSIVICLCACVRLCAREKVSLGCEHDFRRVKERTNCVKAAPGILSSRIN